MGEPCHFGAFRNFDTEIVKGRPPFIFIERGPPIFPYDFASSAVSAVKEAANRAASWPSCPAKDVAAFANANGGYIFIGLATKPAVLRVGEEVSELRPIDKTLFNPDRHRKLLEEWLYPQPADIDIDWIELGNGKGIGLVFVPPQNERSKPFLISRTMGDKKSTELLIGYAERRVDRTEVRNIVEIHQALRTGMNLERELLGRIANIELLIERNFLTKTQVETTKQREQLLKERIARWIEGDTAE